MKVKFNMTDFATEAKTSITISKEDEGKIIGTNGFQIEDIEFVGDESVPAETLVSPHTKNFDEWLSKYFEGDGVHYCYKTKSGHKIFTLKELYKKFERAMKESPIVSG